MILDGLRVEARVITALLLRETRTRFGKHQLGYLWAFVEPVLWVAMFGGMRILLGWHPPSGMDDLFAFMTTGILPFLMFRQSTTKTVGSIASNRALLYYPQVRPLDLVVARSLLELVTFMIVFATLLGVNGMWRGSLHVDNLFVVWCGLVASSTLGTALGLVLCGLNSFTPVVERLMSSFIRPLFWTSGVFFCANDLSSGARNFLLFNPMLHVIEIVRSGWFPAYNSRYIEPLYVVEWIVGLGFVGLTLERVTRRRIQLT